MTEALRIRPAHASRANFCLCVVGLLMPNGLRGDMTAPASGCVLRLQYAGAIGRVRAYTKRDREKKELAREAIAFDFCCRQRRRVVIARMSHFSNRALKKIPAAVFSKSSLVLRAGIRISQEISSTVERKPSRRYQVHLAAVAADGSDLKPVSPICISR
jgi:hypothetical protein